MKTILIIIALSGSPDGGLAIHSVPMKSMEACKAAAEAIAKEQDALFVYRYGRIPVRVATLCVQE